jgi:hypothetical protein
VADVGAASFGVPVAFGRFEEVTHQGALWIG